MGHAQAPSRDPASVPCSDPVTGPARAVTPPIPHTPRDAVVASGCSLASPCADRSQVVLEAVIGDGAAELAAVNDRRAVVHATPCYVRGLGPRM